MNGKEKFSLNDKLILFGMVCMAIGVIGLLIVVGILIANVGVMQLCIYICISLGGLGCVIAKIGEDRKFRDKQHECDKLYKTKYGWL
jgi:hypothetical protein